MKVPFLAAAAIICASSASAAVFNDRATFLSQGGTYTQHTSIGSDFSITPGTNPRAFLDASTYTDIFSPNDYVVVSGVENFTVTVSFATGIFAFGMDVYEPTAPDRFNGCNVPNCVESTFEISFLTGTSLLDTVTFSPENNTLDFIGFSSATAFDTIQVVETIGTNDNEMFGNFVSSTTPLAPVPLPAGLPLLALGLGAFGLASRKRRKTTV